MKDYIQKFLNNFFNSLGITPIYGITLIYIIIILPSIKNIKVWDSMPKQSKELFILKWLAALIGIIFCAIILLNEKY